VLCNTRSRVHYRLRYVLKQCRTCRKYMYGIKYMSSEQVVTEMMDKRKEGRNRE